MIAITSATFLQSNHIPAPFLSRRMLIGAIITLAHIALLYALMLHHGVNVMPTRPIEVAMLMVSSPAKTSTPQPVKLAVKPPPSSVISLPSIVHPNNDAIAMPLPSAVALSDVATAHTMEAISSPTATLPVFDHAAPKLVSAVEYIQAPQANYPPTARRLGEEGKVVMRVLVNVQGRAEKVEVIQSSGFNRLDEAAKLALLRALFKPYIEDGKATTMLATASINFSLRS